MTGLDHVVERTVTIAARRSTVFRFFTDSVRFARWWGEGSTIEPRPGGRVHVRYPNGVVAGGEVIEIRPEERVAFTFGYESGQPVALGASRVTITLEETAAGTVLRLRHELPTAEAAQAHVQGWRYQLAVFANAAAGDQHELGLAALVDRFLALWSEPDDARRREELRAIAAEDLAFRDAFSCTDGIDDLVAHTGAAQRFMPGVRLARSGEPRQCQGTALVDWVATGSDGAARGRGTNVFELRPDGRISRVVGFWSA